MSLKRIFSTILILCSTSLHSHEHQFDELTINSLHQGVRSEQFTFAEVTEYYLKNIKTLNPRLNAVITVNPNAVRLAEEKDKQYKKNSKQGRLFGVPVLLKDNIDTKFLPTTAGALALKKNQPNTNAVIVDKLIAEGAIILGKANLSELANFKSTTSISGLSSVGGQTHNPYDSTITPCGSSSGSAVAVASNLTLVSIGTETDGSIHCPSAMNGVVGFKPSIHHISQQGIIPIAHSQDTAGPITRNVADSIITYQAISNSPAHVKNTSLSGKRIGVIPAINQFNKANEREFSSMLNQLASAGATIINDIELTDMDKVFPAELDILLHEFHNGLNQYLSTTGNTVAVKTLTQLIEYNKANGDTRQELLLAAADATDAKRYQSARKVIDQYATKQLAQIFKHHQLDVIIAPTTGAAWQIDPVNGDAFTGSSTTLAAVTGSPSITIPLGLKKGLPFGLSVIGQINTDENVLSTAVGIEALLGKRQPPKL